MPAGAFRRGGCPSPQPVYRWEMVRSLVGLGSAVGLGSGSRRSAAASGVAAVAPICVLLSME